MKITRKKMNCEVPSVAMGDIAFNLLIFFVILAKARDDSHLQWNPVVAPHTERIADARLSVLIDKERKLYLNGLPIGVGQLKAAIEKQLEGSPAGKRVVLLKIDRDATALSFQPVVEAVSEAGGEIVHILQEGSADGSGPAKPKGTQ